MVTRKQHIAEPLCIPPGHQVPAGPGISKGIGLTEPRPASLAGAFVLEAPPVHPRIVLDRVHRPALRVPAGSLPIKD
ncbi:hypothetical protein B8W90_10965 [Staphylococcus hominis]|nr:hypothetical protein B8W90_10965 [Staphylococcus hominis]